MLEVSIRIWIKANLLLKQALLSPSIPKYYLLQTLPPAKMLFSQITVSL